MDGYEPSTYGDRFADVYDDWYEDVTDVDATVARVAALAGRGPVLELGAGSGRLAVPLAAVAWGIIQVWDGEDTPARWARPKKRELEEASQPTVQ